MITDILSSQRYTTYSWQQIYATGYFSVIALINSGQTCLFHKGFWTVYFGAKEKMWLHYHIVHRGNIYFGGNKGNVKNKEITSPQRYGESVT